MDEDEWSKEQEANRKPGQKHPTPSPVCMNNESMQYLGLKYISGIR